MIDRGQESQPVTADTDPSADSSDYVAPANFIACADGELSDHPLTLPEAIAWGLRNNPRLQIAAQAIERARGESEVAFAPLLPEVSASYKHIVGITDIQGFTTKTLPTVIGFGAGADNFSIAEMHAQWTIWDFGRTMGKYRQAEAGIDIAQLRLARARQSVAYDITQSYFRVLWAQATGEVAAESVRRAESHSTIARSFFEHGVVDRDDVLRADVQVAETKQQLIGARTQERIAVAALNRALGANVSYPTQIVDISDEPVFSGTLGEAIQVAVDNRREFDVARRFIQAAHFGRKAATADFLPRIYVAGTAAQINGTGVNDEDVLIGGINIDLDLYEGGRRVGELRQARSEVRAALARAKEVCDSIAFEVNQAYWEIDDARQRIALSRTAVGQARENLRLVENKFALGDATPTDVIDAETTLTRAQQSYITALYGLHMALSRLDFATGIDRGE